MRTTAGIGFRHEARRILPLVPHDLSFLKPRISDAEPYHLDKSVCSLEATPALLDRLSEWGRQVYEGQSIVRQLHVQDTYERTDLERAEVVELLLSPYASGRDDWDDGCEILNFKSAFHVRWDCNFCNRAVWDQAEELKVNPPCLRGPDFQHTMRFDWLVSTRLLPLVVGSGVTFRPLKGVADHVQLLVDRKCEVQADVLPVSLSDPCPSCGRAQGVTRRDLLEGDLSVTAVDEASGDVNYYPGISITRDLPLTVRLPGDRAWTILRTDLEFGSFHGAGFYGQPQDHRKGDRVRLQRNSFATGERHYYLAKAALVARILDMGIADVSFRPVTVV